MSRSEVRRALARGDLDGRRAEYARLADGVRAELKLARTTTESVSKRSAHDASEE